MHEGVGLRRPGALNKKFKNKAPLFLSGRARMELVPTKKNPPKKCAQYNDMMEERFTKFDFYVPMPKHEREMAFPMCGRCAAAFYLSGASAAYATGDRSPSAAAGAAGPVSAGPIGSVASEVSMLAQLHASGALDADEFKAAKRQLLHF